jgi:hypothetical protein
MLPAVGASLASTAGRAGHGGAPRRVDGDAGRRGSRPTAPVPARPRNRPRDGAIHTSDTLPATPRFTHAGSYGLSGGADGPVTEGEGSLTLPVRAARRRAGPGRMPPDLSWSAVRHCGQPPGVEETARGPGQHGHHRVLHQRYEHGRGDQRPAPGGHAGQVRGEQVIRTSSPGGLGRSRRGWRGTRPRRATQSAGRCPSRAPRTSPR